MCHDQACMYLNTVVTSIPGASQSTSNGKKAQSSAHANQQREHFQWITYQVGSMDIALSFPRCSFIALLAQPELQATLRSQQHSLSLKPAKMHFNYAKP